MAPAPGWMGSPCPLRRMRISMRTSRMTTTPARMMMMIMMMAGPWMPMSRSPHSLHQGTFSHDGDKREASPPPVLLVRRWTSSRSSSSKWGSSSCSSGFRTSSLWTIRFQFYQQYSAHRAKYQSRLTVVDERLDQMEAQMGVTSALIERERD
ncbi:unnamed protein product [Linum trigynum]|uniref:Uncharacterized protein n=1 Tax=Linum trigynum TaxID=586398 RepID=A0AAV2FTU2_9ROSI